MDFRDILLVSDFDRTLTDSTGAIPRENIDAITRFIEGGGIFTVATGRAKASFAAQYSRLPINAPVIVANGALVYDFERDEIISISPLEEDEREIIGRLASRFCKNTTMTLESGLEVYLPDDVFSVAENEFTRRHYAEVGVEARLSPIAEIPLPWLKAVFTGEPESLTSLEDAARELGLPGSRSMAYMFEIQNRDTDKGTAARKLARDLGRSTLICAGDAPNDLAMLYEADLAFIPESADKAMLGRGFRTAAHIDRGTIADIINTVSAL